LTARRTAFVTGAAYGIGAASALALAGDGCDVAVSELKPDDLADVLTAFGHLDVLVNNAGVPLTRLRPSRSPRRSGTRSSTST